MSATELDVELLRNFEQLAFFGGNHMYAFALHQDYKQLHRVLDRLHEQFQA